VHHDLVHGYLLDGSDTGRDFIGAKVFVSHCGGKSEKDAESGTRKLTKDQTMKDSTVRALFNNMQTHVPVPVIIGRSSRLFDIAYFC
jgi:hypothetical protein